MNLDPAMKVIFGRRVIPLQADSDFEGMGRGRSDSPSRRHFVKVCRWEVVGSPDGLIRGSWLPSKEAKRMLDQGDFYQDGTHLKIYSHNGEVDVWVKGTKLFLDQECFIECCEL